MRFAKSNLFIAWFLIPETLAMGWVALLAVHASLAFLMALLAMVGSECVTGVMMPTMPREMLVRSTSGDSTVTWTSLFSTLQPPPPDALPPLEVEALPPAPPT